MRTQPQPRVPRKQEPSRTCATRPLRTRSGGLAHSIAPLSLSWPEAEGRAWAAGAIAAIAVLDWARWLGEERVWALEDCRHVSGSLERFLMASGERVVRVATKLMNDARRAGRERGKSDRIDALAVARAALREGVEALPSAQLAGV